MNQTDEPHTAGWWKALQAAREGPRCGARTRSGVPCRGCGDAEWPLPDARRPEYRTTHARRSGAEPASQLEARPKVCRSYVPAQGGSCDPA